MSVHKFVLWTSCNCWPQNMFHPFLPGTVPLLRRPKFNLKRFWLFHLVFSSFCPGSIRVVQPGYCVPQSFSYMFFFFTCIRRTWCEPFLMMARNLWSKRQARWPWWDLNYGRMHPSLKKRKLTTWPVTADSFYFDIMFFMFRSPGN
jgi:hypothetical protein